MKRERIPATTTKEEGKVLLNYFGGGTYNCVYEIQNVAPPAVVTISVIPGADVERLSNMKKDTREWLVEARGDGSDDTFVLLYRGRYTLTFLNRFKKQLGPSFVREIGSIRVFANMEELAKKYNVELCDKTLAQIGRYKSYYNESGYSLVMQTMEKLGPRWDGTKAEEIFSLLWFFSTSQRWFRFLHHDLRKDNVLTRRYAQTQEFVFNLKLGEDMESWKIKANMLPVVIDFDFASTNLAQFEVDRDRLGSFQVAPPDALVREYVRDLQDANPRRAVFESLAILDNFFQFGDTDENGYDLWSVGMIILENLAPVTIPKIRNGLLVASHRFAQTVNERIIEEKGWRGLYGDYNDKVIAYLFCNTIISCLVAEPQGGVPRFIELPDYGFRYPGFFFNFETTIFTDDFIKNFRRDFHENDAVFGKHRKLIQYLMRWDPQQRGTQGAVLLDFSRKKGDIFYDFVMQEDDDDTQPQNVFSYTEKEKVLDVLTQNDRDSLQKQIGQNSDSKK